MENFTTNILDICSDNKITVSGLDNLPKIVQGRPLFDFVGNDPAVLTSLGQNEEDLFQAEGLFNIAVFPDGRIEGLKIVSSQYQVLQYDAVVFHMLNSLPLDKVNSLSVGVSPNGGRCYAKMDTKKEIEVKLGDISRLTWNMITSTDTTNKFWMRQAFWRLKCTNGMELPDGRLGSTTSKLHKGSLNLDSEINGFIENIEQTEELAETWKKYPQVKLDAPKIEEIFQALDVGPRVQQELLTSELRGEGHSLQDLIDGKKVTAWDAYNAFTQRITDSESDELVKVKNGTQVASYFDELIAA